VKLLLMSDTHMPGRRRSLPARLWQAVEDADVVVHAGDWVGTDLLDLLESRARRLIGVYGNNDGPDVRARLPEVATADLAGVLLLNPGSPTDRRRQPTHTWMTARIAGRRLDRVELHHLER